MSSAQTAIDCPEFHELLARSGWRKHLTLATLTRGSDYAYDGRVDELRVTEDSGIFTLTAKLHGSGPQPYSTQVMLLDRGPRVALVTDCSCPVGVGCKHAAALLVAAELARPVTPPDPLSAWDSWLKRLDTPEPEPLSADPDRRFALLLRGDTQQTPQLLAQAVWLRRLKTREAWGDAQPIAFTAQGFVPAPTGGWDDDTADRLAALYGGITRQIGHQQWIGVQHAHQERALVSLLAAHPAYWESPAGEPLQAGPERTLEIEWREQDDGSQRLMPRIDSAGEGTLILRAQSLWYCDPAAHQLGHLLGDLKLLNALPTAPAVQPGDAPKLRDRLEEHPRLAALAPPVDRGPAEALEVEPRWVLTLRLQRYRYHHYYGRADAWQDGACARLSFDYGLCRLPAQGPAVERRVIDGRVLDVLRHRGLEEAAHEALESHHLLDAQLASTRVRPAEPGFAPGDYVLERARGDLATAEHWLPLMPRLAAAGFQLEFDSSFPIELAQPPDDWTLDISDGSGQWFNLSLGIDIGGQRVDLLPILRRLLADPEFPLRPAPGEPDDALWYAPIDERRRVPLPLKRLRALLEPLLEWIEGMPEGPTEAQLKLGRLQAAVVDEIATRAGLLLRGGDTLRSQLARLRSNAGAVDAPAGFNAELRPYQREGLGWLEYLAEAGLGGVLADDMGLGKTVQVLAHLLSQKQRGKLEEPALIVCPTSLVGNWRAEAARFAPVLRVLVLHGGKREELFGTIAEHDLVITTYPLLPRDREVLTQHRFALLVLDEAQQIKNARTLAAQVVREIPAPRRLAMTGTPLENHLGELWAQFDAVEPGLLGNEKRFTRHYRTPIEKQGDVEKRERLTRRIAPLMLRRRKEDVLRDLPPKNEIQRPVELEGRQRELYETLRLAQHERVQAAVAERGLAQSGIVVLDALLKLRQVCCDPRLVKLAGARRVEESAKLELLLSMLQSLTAEGRRVLVFSQFTEMLDLIHDALDEQGITHFMLTGQTRDRTTLVERFQAGEAPVFLISLKAGGVGLNLTAADTVIHYDPWWNPAVEAQATDRAHRIGQDKAVFVYRLICSGTVEEKIQGLQARKAELARAVLEGGSTEALRFDEGDLEALFAPL